MGLFREAKAKLNNWFDTKTNQALLINGARQVGKSFIIREFCEEKYEHFYEFNLLENRRVREALDLAVTKDEILSVLSLFAPGTLIPGETVIFIDEVQVAKEMVTKIKFLVDDGRYDYILSGSMLGVELNDIESIPVGYLDTITMYPLNLHEYLIARGVKEEHFSILQDCYKSQMPVPEYLHTYLLQLTYEYQIIGGMPDAVQSFVNDPNYATVRKIQKNIVSQYKKDISQYNPDDALVIKELFDLIPAELSAQNKRYTFTKLNENSRYRRLENNFNWLAESNVAISVYNVNEPKFPLMLSEQRNLFKFFLSDVGLLNSMLMKTVTKDLLAKNDKVNYGALYENLVAQEIVANGFKPYYYNSKKSGEVDFVLESNSNGIILVEVKSGKDYNRHRALNNILDVPDYEFESANILSESNIEVKDDVVYLPIYMTMYIGQA